MEGEKDRGDGNDERHYFSQVFPAACVAFVRQYGSLDLRSNWRLTRNRLCVFSFLRDTSITD